MLYPRDFYYLRHGETDWNKEDRGMGQMDIPLNPTGLNQAKESAHIFENKQIDLICHSPLSRAKVTAEIVSDKIKKPLFEIPELKECCWGEFEGKVKGPWIQDWIQGSLIPGAETYENFIQRALIGVNKALAMNKSVLIVSHGGVFWAIQKYAQLKESKYLPNCIPVYLKAPQREETPWGVYYIESSNK